MKLEFILTQLSDPKLRETKGKIPYTLPDDLHLFGKPILEI